MDQASLKRYLLIGLALTLAYCGGGGASGPIEQPIPVKVLVEGDAIPEADASVMFDIVRQRMWLLYGVAIVEHQGQPSFITAHIQPANPDGTQGGKASGVCSPYGHIWVQAGSWRNDIDRFEHSVDLFEWELLHLFGYHCWDNYVYYECTREEKLSRLNKWLGVGNEKDGED